MQLCLQHGLTDKRNGLIVFYGCPQHRRKGMHKGGGGRGERKKKKKLLVSFLIVQKYRK